MVSVTFVRLHGSYQPGMVAGFPPDQAAKLVSLGVAKLYEAPQPAPMPKRAGGLAKAILKGK